jgi:hypothetical protein
MIRVTRPTNDKRDGFSVWACGDGKARLDHKNLHVDSLKLYETAQKKPLQLMHISGQIFFGLVA